MKITEQLSVAEFNYLLSYFSNKKLKNFDDIEQLKQHKSMIFRNIDDNISDIKKGIVTNHLPVSDENLQITLQHLKKIIDELTEK